MYYVKKATKAFCVQNYKKNIIQRERWDNKIILLVKKTKQSMKYTSKKAEITKKEVTLHRISERNAAFDTVCNYD